jgi:small subunit ribosomal protein S6
MPFYEHVFIARQDVPSQTVEVLIDGFAELIEQGGGKVTKKENWGLKSLAYRIKKNRKGHYVLMNLDAPSEAILEMERQMRLHEDILRYLTIRVDEPDEEPSIQMHAKSSRDERARRRRDDRDDDDAPKGASEGSDTPAAETTAPAEATEAAAPTDDAAPAEATEAAAPTDDAAPAEAAPSDDGDATAAEAAPAEETEEVT